MDESKASTGQPKKAKKGNRWLLFVLLGASYLLATQHRIVPAIVSGDLVQTFNISAVSLGILGSAYFYPSVLQYLIALGADLRFPGRLLRLLGYGFLLAAIGTIIFALAPDFRLVVVARGLAGVGLAGVFVLTLLVLAGQVHNTEFATLWGVLNAVGGLGRLRGSIVPLTWLMAAFGWRTAVAVLGAVTLLVAVLVLALANRLITTDSEVNAEKPALDAGRLSPWQGIRVVFGNRLAWPVYLHRFLFSAGSAVLLSLWGVPALMTLAQLSRMEASATLGLTATAGLIAYPLGGYLSDRVWRSRRGPALAGASLTVLGWIPLVFWTDRLSPAFLSGLFVYLGLVSGLSMAVFPLVKELFPARLVGTAYVAYAVFSALGSGLLQVFSGSLLSRFSTVPGIYAPAGFRAIFGLALASLILGAMALLLARETYGLFDDDNI